MDGIPGERGFASVAVFASVVLHVLLAWLLMQRWVDVAPPPHFISVTVVRPVPPKAPAPAIVPKPKIVPAAAAAKPAVHAAARSIPHAAPKMRAQEHSATRRPSMKKTSAGAPVMHFGAAGTQAGLGLDIGTPSGGQGNGHDAIGGFDDAVKQRIQAAKTYPPGIPYMWNECVVEYSVTIDRKGQMLSYRLWGCHDPYLDSAARAAVLMAAPFPLPPDFGGDQYTVFGSLVFKHHQG